MHILSVVEMILCHFGYFLFGYFFLIFGLLPFLPYVKGFLRGISFESASLATRRLRMTNFGRPSSAQKTKGSSGAESRAGRAVQSCAGRLPLEYLGVLEKFKILQSSKPWTSSNMQVHENIAYLVIFIDLYWFIRLKEFLHCLADPPRPVPSMP